jgi:molecular chaperone DnaK (HSP70)
MHRLKWVVAVSCCDAATTRQNQALNNAVLVGGAVRMPFIGRMVKAATGVVPRRTVNPDEAIALGCAVEGAYLDGMVNDLRLIKATPNRKLTASEEKGNMAHIMARASLEKAGRF